MLIINSQITYRVVEDSMLIITPWNNAMHNIENTAKYIFEALLENKSEKLIIEEIVKKYDVDKVIAEKDFNEFIDSLIEKKIFIKEV